MEKAELAIEANRTGIYNNAFSDILNQIFYVAGVIQALGVKAVRNGIAHSVHNGFTVLPEAHDLTHGEKVGYGIATQILLREGESQTLTNYLFLCDKIGYKPSMNSMGLSIGDTEIEKIAKKIVSDPLMRRKPFDTITQEDFKNSIKKLEKMFS
jgi:glycerol dehydrogenase-like iron-containing ADH family enzyme